MPCWYPTVLWSTPAAVVGDVVFDDGGEVLILGFELVVAAIMPKVSELACRSGHASRNRLPFGSSYKYVGLVPSGRVLLVTVVLWAANLVMMVVVKFVAASGACVPFGLHKSLMAVDSAWMIYFKSLYSGSYCNLLWINDSNDLLRTS